MAGAQYIRKHGLRKGNFGGGGRPACAIGAMGEGRGENIPAACKLLLLYLVRDIGEISEPGLSNWAVGVSGWNDADERTAEEVIAAMEGAAYA